MNARAENAVRVVLIANYAPDGQQSMRRFADVLERELAGSGCVVSMVAPAVVFGRLWPTPTGPGKWLGYVDKFIVFPRRLRRVLGDVQSTAGRLVVHICDHSNAIYTRYLQNVPHVVTCNDLLAVRSALGETPEHRTRWSGRVLQRWILAGLNRAQHVVCISETTRQDVARLCRRSEQAVSCIYMGLNYPYQPRVSGRHRERVRELVSDRPYLLHVGGNQWYKNRLGVLRIYAELRARASRESCPRLVMVGKPFTSTMRAFIEVAGLGDDVVELGDVPNSDLEALYSHAELLLYPSLAEGFGWPVLEAMACGCRVVTTARPPLTEVGGDAAAYVDPVSSTAAADVVLKVLRESTIERTARIERGFARRRELTTARMIDNYVALYRGLLGHRAPAPARARSLVN